MNPQELDDFLHRNKMTGSKAGRTLCNNQPMAQQARANTEDGRAGAEVAGRRRAGIGMSRQRGKAAFIGREIVKSATKHFALLGKYGTALECLPLFIEQAASIERIKYISDSVPAKCFKKDGSGIDRRRYKRHLRKNSYMAVKLTK